MSYPSPGPPTQSPPPNQSPHFFNAATAVAGAASHWRAVTPGAPSPGAANMSSNQIAPPPTTPHDQLLSQRHRRFSANSFPAAAPTPTPQAEFSGEYGEAVPESPAQRIRDFNLQTLTDMAIHVKRTARFVKETVSTPTPYDLPSDPSLDYGDNSLGMMPSAEAPLEQGVRDLVGGRIGTWPNFELLVKEKGTFRTKWKKRFFRLVVSDHACELQQQSSGGRFEVAAVVTPHTQVFLSEQSPHEQMKRGNRNSKAAKDGMEFHIENPGDVKVYIVPGSPTAAAVRSTLVEVIGYCASELQRRRDNMLLRQSTMNTAVDEDALADEALDCTAIGPGRFRAVVGEPTSFEVHLKNADGSPRDVGELYHTFLHPFNEHKRLLISLHSMTDEEAKEIDAAEGERKQEGESDPMSQLGKGGHHYDLNAELILQEGYPESEFGIMDESALPYCEAGRLKCKYTVTRVGAYRLDVKLGKHHIQGSPFIVTAVPGKTFAKQCVAYGPGLSYADPSAVNTFTIEARDRLGYPRAEGGDSFFVSINHGAAVLQGDVIQSDGYNHTVLAEDNKNGTYTVRYQLDPMRMEELKRLAETPHALLAAKTRAMASTQGVVITVQIDDETAFASSTIDRYREDRQQAIDQLQYGDTGMGMGMGGDMMGGMGGGVEYDPVTGEPLPPPPDEDDIVLDRTQLPTRVNIKGSEFHIPVSSSMPNTQDARDKCARPPASGEDVPVSDAPPKLSYLVHENAALGETKSSPVGSSSSSMMAFSSSPPYANTKSADALAEKLRQQEEQMALQARELATLRRELAASRLGSPPATQVAPQDGGFPLPPPPSTAVDSPAIAAPTPMSTPNAKSQAILSASDEANALMQKHRAQLRRLFDNYASGGTVVFASFLELCADFDLYPTFLDKDGIQACFQIGTSGSPQANFDNFVAALYQLASDALSKKMFQDIYPRDVDKVGVLLTLWALADPAKLEEVQNRRRLKATS